MSTARAPLAVACAALGVLLQGCLPKPPKKCAEAGFNCMDTGCCVSPGMKCYKRDDDWASCKASCTPGFSTSCEEVSTDGPRQEKRDHAVTPAPTPAPTPPPTPAPTPAPTPPPAPMREEEVEWETATWTTGYWDCCKPSCSWEGKGNTTGPVASCNASTGKRADPGTKSVCDGGAAVTCANQQPFAVHANLSMGFAAAAVSGRNGLVGDENCSQCFELLFTDDRHLDEATGDLWGGASPGLQGRRMVVQVTNIGFDVTGNHSFDVLVPGAGQGIFDKGCKANYPGHETDDFDCGRRHGGCSNKTGCAKLPQELRDGCEWHFDWYRWLMHDGRTNNPYVKFRRVRCPKRLTAISGSVPTDDSNFPAVIESAEFYFIA